MNLTIATDSERKVYWITGASSGIGEACAKLLARQGHNLILSARREKELQRVKRDMLGASARSEDIVVLPFDITDYEAMEIAVQQANTAFGRIDILYNNAGISQRSLCVDTSMEAYRKLFEVDVFGQIALTKLVLPIMLKQRSGQLAVTSSVAGKVGAVYRTGYCAVKHALMGFFDALRTEVADQGIQVSTVVPGFIQTAVAIHALTGDGSESGQTDKNVSDGMDVDEAALVIVRGLQQGRKEIPVGKGKEMRILWIRRFFPEFAFRKMLTLAKPKT